MRNSREMRITRRITVRLPVVRVRSMFIGMCALCLGIAGPLVLVWKQSYINRVSIRLENRADTLAALNRKITSLDLECGRLLAAPRVERIARSRGFDYPSSGQLEVLEVGASLRKRENGMIRLFASVKRFLFGEADT